MNKKILLLLGLISLLVCVIIVSAEYQSLPTSKCYWKREATEYRPEREFQGVWGRFVRPIFDETINKTVYETYFDCFSPGGISNYRKALLEAQNNPPKPIPIPVCEEVTIEVCEEEVEVCEEECHWIPYCNQWCGYGCYNWCCDWNWEMVCEEECYTEEQICHEETTSIC